MKHEVTCPPEYDPRKNCICCAACFDTLSNLDYHMKNRHPELYDQWKSIVKSWEEEC